MPSTIHVVARFVAKSGKEDALKTALTAMIAPTRRELGCYQYDLLVSAAEPREFCFVERWDGDKAIEQHVDSAHFKHGMGEIEKLVEGPPEIRRYTYV